MSEELSLLPLSVMTPHRGGHTVVYGHYIFELCPDHRKANQFGFVQQHRLVMERHLGRYLESGIHVHHLDQVKTNNAIDNLHACTRSEHMRLHREDTRNRCLAPLTEEGVREALQKYKLKRAAQFLNVNQQTLRNRFPTLVAPYKRRSPSKIEDQEAIAKILLVAPNNKKGYREVAKETGISYRTCQRICERNGIPWARKSKNGEIHRTYRRKTSNHLK